MKITRISPLTGLESSMELDITQEQIDEWRAGELIQYAMPGLTRDEREFFMNGYTSEDWDKMFPDEVEDKNDGDITHLSWGI